MMLNAACRSASGAGGGIAAVGQSDSLLTGSISFFRSSLRKSVISTPLWGFLTTARGFGAGGGFGFDFLFGETVRFANAFAFFFDFFFIIDLTLIRSGPRCCGLLVCARAVEAQ